MSEPRIIKLTLATDVAKPTRTMVATFRVIPLTWTFDRNNKCFLQGLNAPDSLMRDDDLEICLDATETRCEGQQIWTLDEECHASVRDEDGTEVDLMVRAAVLKLYGNVEWVAEIFVDMGTAESEMLVTENWWKWN